MFLFPIPLWPKLVAGRLQFVPGRLVAVVISLVKSTYKYYFRREINRSIFLEEISIKNIESSKRYIFLKFGHFEDENQWFLQNLKCTFFLVFNTQCGRKKKLKQIRSSFCSNFWYSKQIWIILDVLKSLDVPLSDYVMTETCSRQTAACSRQTCSSTMSCSHQLIQTNLQLILL